MKTLKVDDKTFEFLSWLTRQDVTLPAVLKDYLKWNCYAKEEIKLHLRTLNSACVNAQQIELK